MNSHDPKEKMKMKSRRGVSEIVASLIMLIIVSTMGVMLYNLSMSNISSQQNSLISDTDFSKTVAQERFEIITAKGFNKNSESYLNVTFYNYGQIDVNIIDVYIKSSTGIVRVHTSDQNLPPPFTCFIKNNGKLNQSDFSYLIVNVPDISQITSCKIVSAEGVTNEIQVSL